MMAEQKNIRRKDTRDFNYDKHKLREERKRRERERRSARQKRQEPNL
jgi:hypothetical protein